MKVVFRVDASTRVGTGHVMRCVTLAEAFRERGGDVRFICREHDGNLNSLLQQKGLQTTALPRPARNRGEDEDYASWLGVPQDVDAAQTVAAMAGERPDWLVVDNYGLSAEWERRLRPHVNKLMVIDDLANRVHECDILLDQNFSTEGKRRYAGLVPADCRLMTGPRYAQLRPEYARHRKALRVHTGRVGRVLVYFGGSDPHNTTGLALQALSSGDLRHLAIDLVIGPANPHRKAIQQEALGRPLTTVHGLIPQLADLLASADLAIGAGGATTWERMCLGVPTLLISIAENQRSTSEALANAQLVSYAGHFDLLTVERLAGKVRELAGAGKALVDLSTRNQLLVDGLGKARLAETLVPAAPGSLRLRPAHRNDVVLFYNWVNDPEVRANSFSVAPISWATHENWFASRVASDTCHLFVLEAGGLPVGQVRFDVENNEARIDYSLDEFVRGRGWGTRLLALGLDAMRRHEPARFSAHVKGENIASRSVFEKLGFAPDPRGPTDHAVFYLDPKRLETRRPGAVPAK